MDRNDIRVNRFRIEKDEEWSKWVKDIPTINFDTEWGVQVIPPFSGAMARFRVKKGDMSISVYLDCYDVLGYYGEPYWEIYPYEDDTYRCRMNNVDELVDAIRQSFEDWENE